MPHLRLEYTSNIDAGFADRALFEALHCILADHGISIGNCKSRAEERQVYLVGDGSGEQAFVHLDVSMLEGRSVETKRSIGESLLAALIDVYAGSLPRPQITVEVRDITRATYFKDPPGTI